MKPKSILFAIIIIEYLNCIMEVQQDTVKILRIIEKYFDIHFDDMYNIVCVELNLLKPHRCKAISKNGQQCKRMGKTGHSFCHCHIVQENVQENTKGAKLQRAVMHTLPTGEVIHLNEHNGHVFDIDGKRLGNLEDDEQGNLKVTKG